MKRYVLKKVKEKRIFKKIVYRKELHTFNNTYMFKKLSEIKEIEVFKTEVNFILVKIKKEIFEKGMDSKKLQEEMLKHGILIRDASNFIFLDKKYFRLAIKDRKNNDFVLKILKEILSQKTSHLRFVSKLFL